MWGPVIAMVIEVATNMTETLVASEQQSVIDRTEDEIAELLKKMRNEGEVIQYFEKENKKKNVVLVLLAMVLMALVFILVFSKNQKTK